MGQSVLKSLSEKGFELIGADSSSTAAGRFLADSFEKVPKASSPNYIQELSNICSKRGVDILIPGLDAEVQIIAEEVAGPDPHYLPKTVTQTPAIVKIADDKLMTAEFLEMNGYPFPKTSNLEHGSLDKWFTFPAILKPKTGGARSIGVYRLAGLQDLERLRLSLPEGALDNYVIQEFVEGPEYTCGTLRFDGEFIGGIAMRRTLRSGDTHKAVVEKNHIILKHLRDVTQSLGTEGPCNFQMKMNGATPYIFEINSRFSGTTAGRALAGFNEALYVVSRYLGLQVPKLEIREVLVTRYWNESATPVCDLEEDGIDF